MAKGFSLLDRGPTEAVDRFRELSTELDRLVRRAVVRGRVQRVIDEWPVAVRRAAPLFVVAALFLFVFRLAWAVTTTAAWPVSGGVAFLALFLPFLLAVLAQLTLAVAETWSRARALAWLDERLALADRLTSADEFLKTSDRSGFMLAALEQTVSIAAEALHRPLVFEASRGAFGAGAWRAPVFALVVFLVAMLVPARKAAVLTPPATSPTATARAEAPRKNDEETPAPRKNAESQPARERVNPTTMPSKSTTNRETADRDDQKEEKRSGGMTKQGGTASAGAPSGSAAAKGQPTAQGTPSKPQPPGKKIDRKPKAQKEKTEAPPPKKEVKETSGATMSRGAAGGATKNPVASDWSTRDEVQIPEDEPLRDDESVEDDDSAEQARGGVQPNLRDRRPPPNRDLSISFGIGKLPGNGRGGPSAQKKSRGTASLVFGVPVPDHVRGKLNPGTTKVTQERVEPRPEDAPPIDAGARRTREAPAGFVPEDTLSPAMRRLLKNYTLRLRAESMNSPNEKGQTK